MTEIGGAVDPYVAKLRASRNSRAVLKARLATLRSSIPRIAIFVLEGIEDKGIYFQWIQRIRPTLNYEPFPCGGKKYVMMLKEAVDRDLGNLRDDVYFFVDRDYDDLDDTDQSPEIFMTERYAVENYLVEGHVLNATLRDDFHCHAHPEVRATLVDRFDRLYNEFLAASKAVNLRIFYSRKLRIEVVGGVPNKIADFCSVTLDSVTATDKPSAEIIPLAEEPAAMALGELLEEFEALEPRERYRGKYAFAFFQKILALLADERIAGSALFAGAEPVGKLRINEISMSVLASRSELPIGLQEFLGRIPAEVG